MAYKNRKDQAAAAKRHYILNKEKVYKRAKLHDKEVRQRNREFIYVYLKEHPCVDCGETDPVVLEFDHVRGTKIKEVSLMSNNCVAISTLLKEIEKCEIRCANCHRRVTWLRRKLVTSA